MKQVAALIEAASTLRYAHPAATYRTLVGLLAVTGMRIGEALALDRGDIDPKEGSILVRETKFAKSRELPLHMSTVEAVLRYLGRADRPRAAAGTDAVFVSARGARLAYRSCERHLFPAGGPCRHRTALGLLPAEAARPAS